MELKAFLTVFAAVFVAELGDKTQLATMLFAADEQVSKWLVFAAASAALVVAAGLGVLAGGAVANVLSPRVLSLVAGIGFIVAGVPAAGVLDVAGHHVAGTAAHDSRVSLFCFYHFHRRRSVFVD